MTWGDAGQIKPGSRIMKTNTQQNDCVLPYPGFLCYNPHMYLIADWQLWMISYYQEYEGCVTRLHKDCVIHVNHFTYAFRSFSLPHDWQGGLLVVYGWHEESMEWAETRWMNERWKYISLEK